MLQRFTTHKFEPLSGILQLYLILRVVQCSSLLYFDLCFLKEYSLDNYSRFSCQLTGWALHRTNNVERQQKVNMTTFNLPSVMAALLFLNLDFGDSAALLDFQSSEDTKPVYTAEDKSGRVWNKGTEASRDNFHLSCSSCFPNLEVVDIKVKEVEGGRRCRGRAQRPHLELRMMCDPCLNHTLLVTAKVLIDGVPEMRERRVSYRGEACQQILTKNLGSDLDTQDSTTEMMTSNDAVSSSSPSQLPLASPQVGGNSAGAIVVAHSPLLVAFKALLVFWSRDT